MSDLILAMAMIVIDDYLNAGTKEDRKNASKRAKKVYKMYYNKPYKNRNER